MSQDAGIDIDMDRELARIQAQAASAEPGAGEKDGPPVVAGEVVDDGSTVEFMGRKFRIADRVGLMPLLKFSAHANLSTADPAALGAMYAMLRDCIRPASACGDCKACKDGREPDCKDYDPGDWDAFERHAMDTRAEADDLLDVITKTMEHLAGRPTRQSLRSSRGPRAISGGSTGRSSARRGKGSKR